jgi:cardiolipin synthase
LRPQLEAAGVKVLIYRPEIARFRLRRHRLRRLHRKLAVADGRCAFVGGINIVDDIDAARPAPPRFDYAVRIEGPLLAPIHASVRRLWTLVAWAGLRRRLRLPAASPVTAEPRGSTRAAFVIRDNLRHRRDIEEAYLEAIDRARGEILIANAYFLPGGPLPPGAAGCRGARRAGDHAAAGPRRIPAAALRHPVPLRRLLERRHSHLRIPQQLPARQGGGHRRCWATVGLEQHRSLQPAAGARGQCFRRRQGIRCRAARQPGGGHAGRRRELRCEDWQRKPWLQRLASWLAYGLVRLMIGIAGFGGKH